jgi:hypothetical protein
MLVLKQVKMGLAVPVALVVTTVWAYVAGHGLLLGLERVRDWFPTINGLLERFAPLGSILGYGILALVAVPLLPLVVAGLVQYGLQLLIWLMLDGMVAAVIWIVITWIWGATMLLWIKDWSPDWATRPQWPILRYWKRQLVVLAYTFGYGSPVVLGCLLLFKICRWLDLLG